MCPVDLVRTLAVVRGQRLAAGRGVVTTVQRVVNVNAVRAERRVRRMNVAVAVAHVLPRPDTTTNHDDDDDVMMRRERSLVQRGSSPNLVRFQSTIAKRPFSRPRKSWKMAKVMEKGWKLCNVILLTVITVVSSSC